MRRICKFLAGAMVVAALTVGPAAVSTASAAPHTPSDWTWCKRFPIFC
jgi:hypothetical protein